MRLCYLRVVSEHGDGGDDVIDVGTPCGFAPSFGEKCAYAKLSDRNGRDCDVIVVVDDLVELIAGPLGVDEERSVE